MSGPMQAPEGGGLFTVDAPNFAKEQDRDCLKLGVLDARTLFRAEHGLSWQLGQLYGVVQTGLILTQHIFVGLRRGMLIAGDGEAAKEKMAFTWAARRDAQAVGDKFNLKIRYRDAPPNRVFCVYASPNKMLDEYPEIFGWLEHWTWLAANSELPGAPVEWQDRYDKKLWSAPPGAAGV